MIANILPADTPSTTGLGQKVKTLFFLKVVMLHIKLKGMEHRAPCKQIFCLDSRGGDKKVKTFFSESGRVANKIKGKEV